MRDQKDSVGGILTCIVRNLPIGLGEPVFDRLEAKLAQAMLSIPATKGFEIGSGFKGTEMIGSKHNDLFQLKSNGNLGTKLIIVVVFKAVFQMVNHYFLKVAFKPPATIGLSQETSTFEGEKVTLEAKGRHDPCVVPRAVPIVESMTFSFNGFGLRQMYRDK